MIPHTPPTERAKDMAGAVLALIVLVFLLASCTRGEPVGPEDLEPCVLARITIYLPDTLTYDPGRVDTLKARIDTSNDCELRPRGWG